MSESDDLHDVTPPISSDDAERLLSGASVVEETPELADVNSVLRALRAPAESTELAGLASAVSAFGGGDVSVHSDPSTPRTIPMIRKRLTRKTLAAIGVVTLVSAGAAAAAGGVPSPFSSSKPPASTAKDLDDEATEVATEEATDEVEVTEPTSTTDGVETTEAIDTTESLDAAAAGLADAPVDSAAKGPDVNGPAKFGLCTAFAARTKHDPTTTTQAGGTPAAEPDTDLPVPFQALTDAANAAGQSVAEFCADAVPGGADDGSGAPAENPSAAPGHSGDNPSATAPGHSGDNPSSTAPGHSDSAHGPADKHP